MGKEYTDRKGKKHNWKTMKAMNNHTCRFKCSENITEEQRQKYFDKYWSLGDWELQSSFLNSVIALGETNRKIQNAVRSRKFSSQFYLGDKRVCKTFFLVTLDVSHKRVDNIAKKKMLVKQEYPLERNGVKGPHQTRPLRKKSNWSKSTLLFSPDTVAINLEIKTQTGST